MSRNLGYSVAARAGQMCCAPIKPRPSPAESLLIINGLLLLIISAGFVVSGVVYAIAISSLTRDFFVGAQSGSTGSVAIRNALWHGRDPDAEPR